MYSFGVRLKGIPIVRNSPKPTRWMTRVKILIFSKSHIDEFMAFCVAYNIKRATIDWFVNNMECIVWASIEWILTGWPTGLVKVGGCHWQKRLFEMGKTSSYFFFMIFYYYYYVHLSYMSNTSEMNELNNVLCEGRLDTLWMFKIVKQVGGVVYSNNLIKFQAILH